MKKISFTLIFILTCLLAATFSPQAQAQVLISKEEGTADESAMLEIRSTDGGVLIPRMTSGQRQAITAKEGLLVYDVTLKAFFIYGKDSKGNVTWYNISENAGLWSKNGKAVYLSDPEAKVGIGTTNPNKKLVIQAQGEDDTLMEIRDKNGNPLMVITPQLTKFNIIKENASASGTSGGFAVGRYALAKDGKATDTTLFVVTPDSTRVFTIGKENAGASGTSGGFAVGRYALAKDGKGNIAYNFFTDTKRTRVFTVGQENAGAAGTSGGFAVGRYALAKGDTAYNFFTDTERTRVYTVGPETAGAAGTSGGFAVGRYALAKGDTAYNFFTDTERTRVYTVGPETAGAAGTSGGFAVGRYALAKGDTTYNFFTDQDSTKVVIPVSDERVGGFSVLGQNPNKAGDLENKFDVSTGTTAEVINGQNRVLWYPQKNAFLAGRLYVPHADSVGENSLAIGYECQAKGDYSTAIGYSARADSASSFAFGDSARALNIQSYAFGRGAKAIGLRSFAFGSGVPAGSSGSYNWDEARAPQAQGDYSYAFGLGSVSSGYGSFTMGFKDTASNYFSTAMGRYTVASGRGSTAMGYNTVASGENSTAMGLQTKAIGINSTAMGYFTTANRDLSTAMGYATKANGWVSTAMGSWTEANGDISTAMGSHTTASGENSTAMGRNTTASGFAGTAMGRETKASGESSTAMGRNTTASGDYGSTAMGYNTIASGQVSTAMGKETSATSTASIAIGYLTNANGYASMATGVETNANGYTSITMGAETNAGGYASMATGVKTNASGHYSTAMGTHIKAKGASTFGIGLYDYNWSITTIDSIEQDNTMAIMGGRVGIGTVAPAGRLHVAGAAGTLPTVNSNTVALFQNNAVSNDEVSIALISGTNGISNLNFGDTDNSLLGSIKYHNSDNSLYFYTNSSAKMTINSLGNVGIGTVAPEAPLDVETNTWGHAIHIEEAGSGNEDWQIGVDSDGDLNFFDGLTNRISFRDGGNVGIGTTSPTANLHIKQVGNNEEGLTIENDNNSNTWSWEIGTEWLNLSFNGTDVGHWNPDGSYSTTSDKRLKKDISLYDKKVLDGVLNIKPVTYRLKHVDANAQKTFGFIAQEVKEYFPELVRKGENGYYGLHYPDFGVLAIKAIQEQQAEIESQSKKIEIQNKKIEILEQDNKKIEKQAGEIEMLKQEIKELKKLIQK